MRASNIAAVVGSALASSCTGSLKPKPGILGATTWKVGTFSFALELGVLGLHNALIMRDTARKLSGKPCTNSNGIALEEGDLCSQKVRTFLSCS